MNFLNMLMTLQSFGGIQWPIHDPLNSEVNTILRRQLYNREWLLEKACRAPLAVAVV
jgi:hypothetical protein